MWKVSALARRRVRPNVCRAGTHEGNRRTRGLGPEVVSPAQRSRETGVTGRGHTELVPERIVRERLHFDER